MNDFFYFINELFWIIVIILGIISIIFLRYFIERVLWFYETIRIDKILFLDKNIEKYIIKSEKAAKKYIQPENVISFKLNISYGYLIQGDVLSAIKYLEDINIEKCSTTLKGKYYNSLSYYYCLFNDLEKAMFYFSKGEVFINELYKSLNTSPLPLRTIGYIEMLKENYIKAENIFLELKENLVKDSYFKTTININLAKVYIKTDRYDEAKILLESISRENLFPIDKIEVEQLFKELII